MKKIISYSGGKDSTASVILAHLHNLQIDEIVFAEVMYNHEISAEWPDHIKFILDIAFPAFEKWGYKCTAIKGEKTYKELFYHEPVKGRYKGTGKIAGFPMAGRCNINAYGKRGPIKKYLKLMGQHINYVGIAADETSRIARLSGNQKSLLVEYGYTEKMARKLCEDYDLLSPIYQYVERNGCWFCPNMKKDAVKELYTRYPELYNRIIQLEREEGLIGCKWNTLTGKNMEDMLNA